MNEAETLMGALRDLRQERGITQGALARRAGFNVSEISKWERGARDIKLWQFMVLAEVLRAHVELKEQR